MAKHYRERIVFRSVIVSAAAVFVLFTAFLVISVTRKVQWNNMLLDLSFSTAAVGDRDNMRADYPGEEPIRVEYDNAKRIYLVLQNSGLGSYWPFAPVTQDIISCDYGNGTSLRIYRCGANSVYIRYNGPSRDYAYHIGTDAEFSYFLQLVSLQGSSNANSLWED